MKRVIVATVLLVLIIGTCVGSLLWQRQQTVLLTQQMEEVAQNFNPDSPEQSLPATEQLIESFKKRTVLLPMFIRHSTLSDIECELEALPAMLTTGEPKDFTPALARCRHKLWVLYELELPSFENIF